MALDGTFTVFSVLDVARWLCSLKRTGVLTSVADRGDVRVWFGDGGIVAAESDGREVPPDPAEALFDIMRAGPIEWRFETGSLPDRPLAMAVDPQELVPRLEGMVEEWGRLVALVPSTESVVALAAEIDGEVVLTGDRWALVVRLAGGPLTFGDLLGDFAADDIARRRQVADLVRAGLARVERNDDVVADRGAVSHAPG